MKSSSDAARSQNAIIAQEQLITIGGRSKSTKMITPLERVPITKEAMEKNRRSVLERLGKRTLRGKIIKLIDDNIHFRCNKLMEHQKKQKNLHENGIYYKTLAYQEKSTESDFKKRPMVFSRVESSDFFPKSKLVCKSDEPAYFSVGDRFDSQFTNEEHETMEAFAKICKRLTREELLEIGEDPNYFIVKPNHRQRKQLLNAKLWDDVAGLKDLLDYDEDDADMLKKKKSFNESQPARQLRLDRLEQLSMNKEQLRQLRETDFLQSPTDDGDGDAVEKKKLFIEQLRSYLLERHHARQKRFEARALEEEQNKIERKYEFEQKYSEKIQRAERTIQEIKEAVVRKKHEAQRKQDEQLRLIHKNQMKKKEDDEIFLMNTQLRRILIEHQIEENKNSDIANKLEKIKNLAKYTPAKKQLVGM